MRKILVFGETGQVAAELRALAGPALEVDSLGRDRADLADPQACAAVVAGTDADAVINAAAYTAVDAAEDDEAAATIVNAEAPAAMARAAAARDLPFVQISTDYVFPGDGDRAWAPDDPTGPLNAYGRTKLAGEQGVLAAGGASAVLRTSWVFSPHRGNFVKTMLRLASGRDRLAVVADQVGGPTAADDIARACIAVAKGLVVDPGRAGVYHFSGAPDVSWADFAREIFARSGHEVAVDNIATEAFPTPARRPRNSRLDCAAVTTAFGVARPDWRDGLARTLARL